MLLTSAAVPACAQSMQPLGAQPAHSLPAKVTSPSRLPAIESRAVLRKVTILRGQTSVEVHIEASGPVKPAAMVLSGPERIVVDLTGVGYDGSRHLSVNAGDVEGVRVALFKADPPVTRVVVDLARRHEYRLLPAGSTVILAIDTSAKTAIEAQPRERKAAVVASSAIVQPAVLPLATTPAPASEPKLQPPAVVGLPNPSTSGVSAPPVAVEPETPPSSESATAWVTQPAIPTVSTTLPQVAPIAIPANTAQSSGDEETTPHQAAKAEKPGVVSSVSVSHRKDAVEVHIKGNKPLRAYTSTVSKPERIIIDLANVRLDHPHRIPVNAADVQLVSASLYLVNPLVTRVVINLARPHPYHVQASGNSLTVRIDTGIETAGSPPVQ